MKTQAYDESVNLPPYSFGEAFSAWHFDAVTAVFVALAAVAYGWRMERARRGGTTWPWWRAAIFVGLGLGGVVVATMSSLAVYQHTVLWAFVVQVSLLMTVIPVALAGGDPVGLVRAGCRPAHRARLDAALRSPIARVLTFPLLAAVLGVVVQMLIFFGPLLRPALEHTVVMNLVYLLALLVGCLLAWPLLGEDLLPTWCTPPLRMLFAAVDGLLDAVPGIALVAASGLVAGGYFADHQPPWVESAHAGQQLAGSLAVAIAEVVAIPLLVVLFFQWARSELASQHAERSLVSVERSLVSVERSLVSVERSLVPDEESLAPGEESLARAEKSVVEEPALERPWWETDPRFGRRTEEFRPGSDR